MNRLSKHWNRITAVSLLASAAWIVLTALVAPAPDPSEAAYPRVGFPAPGLELTTLQGESISLHDVRGKAVVLNFWASWCPPCKAEMPAIQRLTELYSADKLAILSVNATGQDNLADVQTFVEDYRLTFPILLDAQGDASRLYQVQALPTTFFIDQAGVIQKIVYGGPLSEAFLRAEIDRLLGGGT